MDFSFTPEQEALRREFAEFFREAMKEAPPYWSGDIESRYTTDEGWAFHRKMARMLAEKGWLVRAWPKEYGGQNASPIEQMIFAEVAEYYQAPGVDVFGVRMIGPTILALGTAEQKKEHLPPIARGEIMWCQGWSEPNAGSDLAALTTRAVREGEYYIVNGQKIWTTGAHRADWIFLLVRTDPTAKRSRGLTFLLADKNTPGITVRPVLTMEGSHAFNEVFLDDVKIPVRNRLGAENEGWQVTRVVMNFERTSVGEIAKARRELEELIEFCKETWHGNEPLIKNPLIRNQLAGLFIEIEVGRAFMYKIAWMHEKGELLSTANAAYASAAKLYGTELTQRLAYTGSQIMGLYGQVKTGSRWAPLHGKFERAYQLCMGMNIAAGTSEIQKNLIAWTALELPRI